MGDVRITEVHRAKDELRQDVETGTCSPADGLALGALLSGLPKEAADFLARKRLTSDFVTFARLARRALDGARSLTAALEYDPEDKDEQWVTLDVTVDGALEHVFLQYNECVRQMTRQLPAHARAAFRLSLEFV